MEMAVCNQNQVFVHTALKHTIATLFINEKEYVRYLKILRIDVQKLFHDCGTIFFQKRAEQSGKNKIILTLDKPVTCK